MFGLSMDFAIGVSVGSLMTWAGIGLLMLSRGRHVSGYSPSRSGPKTPPRGGSALPPKRLTPTT